MIQKACNNILYPEVKAAFRTCAPTLVPVTESLLADEMRYKQSLKALDGFDDRKKKWPRA